MSILSKVFTKDKFKCLTCPTHERTQSNMDFDFCDFYMYTDDYIKGWNTEYAEIPSNHYLLPKKFIPYGIDFDFILSQNKFGQIQYLMNIAKVLNTPLISLEHTLPLKQWNQKQFDYAKKLKGDVNIYISRFSAEAWEEDNPYIIEHCVNTDIFKPQNIERNNHILTVANDYINRNSVLNFDQYKNVTSGLPTLPIGDTPGFSKAAESVKHLSNIYASSRIFLNTAHWSPIPTSLLEAMSSGCACVSCNTCAIPEYIDHGVNGFLARNDKEMKEYLLLLLNDRDLAETIGEKARDTILNKCSKQKYVEKWKDLFKKLSNVGDIREG